MSVVVAGVLGSSYPAVAAVFPFVAAVTVGFSVFRAAIRPVANAMLLSAGLSYESVRAYGSIDFGISAVGAGVANARLGSVVFCVFGVGMAVLAVVLLRIPVDRRPPTESVGLRAASLVRDRNFAALLVVASLMGTLFPAMSASLSVYVRSLDGSDALTGLSVAAKTLGEAAVFLTAA